VTLESMVGNRTTQLCESSL